MGRNPTALSELFEDPRVLMCSIGDSRGAARETCVRGGQNVLFPPSSGNDRWDNRCQDEFTEHP